jgi:hypothetical protein
MPCFSGLFTRTPKKQQTEDAPLLQLIPKSRRSRRQKKLLPIKHAGNVPIYKLLRAPTYLEELGWKEKDQEVILWRENQTAICIGKQKWHPMRDFLRHATFEIETDEWCVCCTICGQTDAAIVETTSFFWPTQSRENKPLSLLNLSFSANEHPFDFAALTGVQLAQIIDANPMKNLFWETHINAEQSEVLASRLYSFHLVLGGKHFAFTDGGTAFVQTLEQRTSSFGSLELRCFPGFSPFSRMNLQRLLGLSNIFEKLTVNCLDEEFALFPFAAKVPELDCMVEANHFQPDDIRKLDIWTKNLSLTIFSHEADNSVEAWIAFFTRMAKLGHFESLRLIIFPRFMVHERDLASAKVAAVAEALACVIKENRNLIDLYLWTPCYFDLAQHIQKIFKAMEEHESLERFFVNKYPVEDPDFNWLEPLLLRNKKISVIDCSSRGYPKGSRIDRLSKLNGMYRIWAPLMTESAEVVKAGFAELTTESSLLFSAYFLSENQGMLCELVEGIFIADEELS